MWHLGKIHYSKPSFPMLTNSNSIKNKNNTLFAYLHRNVNKGKYLSCSWQEIPKGQQLQHVKWNSLKPGGIELSLITKPNIILDVIQQYLHWYHQNFVLPHTVILYKHCSIFLWIIVIKLQTTITNLYEVKSEMWINTSLQSWATVKTWFFQAYWY